VTGRRAGATKYHEEGTAALTDRVREAVRGVIEELRITVPLADSRTVHTIENRGEVLERTYQDGTVTLRAKIGRRQLDQLRSAGARMEVEPAAAPGAKRKRAAPKKPARTK
jgi:50S ribosomal subunit-associated GTPase HflX